jgi:hypothetical protein
MRLGGGRKDGPSSCALPAMAVVTPAPRYPFAGGLHVRRPERARPDSRERGAGDSHRRPRPPLLSGPLEAVDVEASSTAGFYRYPNE